MKGKLTLNNGYITSLLREEREKETISEPQLYKGQWMEQSVERFVGMEERTVP